MPLYYNSLYPSINCIKISKASISLKTYFNLKFTYIFKEQHVTTILNDYTFKDKI